MPHARPVWINEDNAHFYDCHPPQDMTVPGLQRLVDAWCASPGSRVGGMLFCTNVQRALFDSRVWEPLYHGYDPDDPTIERRPEFAFLPPRARGLTPDQRGRYWVHQIWLLRQRGIDHLQVWLDRCRHHGVAGWLTMRMNDCHHNDAPDAFWHSTLWKTRPDLRRATGRDGDWFNDAFDYGQPEVVAHHLALVRELTERFDFDGLELDWVRWVRHFRPGHEPAGAATLTGFMREARALLAAAGRRTGRASRLGVRLPSDVTACLQLGYDVLTWAAEGLVDQVTLAPFFQQAEFEWPVRHWRHLFGERVKILCQCESIIRPHPGVGQSECFIDYPLLFGSAAAAHQAGADGVYLFNECYRQAPGDRWAAQDPGLLDMLSRGIGDRVALRDVHRRHPVSHAQIVGPGSADGSPLPIPLRKPDGHWSFGRHGRTITLRIALGDRPLHAPLRIELGFDHPIASEGLRLWLNGQPLQAWSEPLDLPRPRSARHVLACPVPIAAARDGINTVELLPADHAASQLVWTELVVERCQAGSNRVV